MDVAVAPASGADAPPPLMATYSNTTGFSPPSDGDLDLQWDQTYLRINYIVRNLAGPVPLQLHHRHSYQHLYPGPATHDGAMSDTSSERRRRLEARDPAPATVVAGAGHQPTAGLVGDSPTLGYPTDDPGAAAGGHAAGRPTASVRRWPSLAPERAAEMSTRVSVWTEEVSAQGEEAYCACSAPWAAARLRPPPEGADDEGCSSATARGLLPAALVAGSAGGSSALASPAANTTGPVTGSCKICGRPLDPTGNAAAGGQSDSSCSRGSHAQASQGCPDDDTGRGENGDGGGTKKTKSRVHNLLHRFKRLGRNQRDLQDLINEKNGAGSSNNDGNNDDSGETKAIGGDGSAAPSGQGRDQQPLAAAATTAALAGSSGTLMYRTKAPGNGSPTATPQQPQNQQPGARAPAGQGRRNTSAFGPVAESSGSSTADSSRRRRTRDSAARLERARLQLERLNGHPLPHPPPPTAPPSNPPPAPPSRGSKGK
ncbi:hypothetical protein GGTG_14091 [Gaeumannomyces tritici R3-111a-1]|uniref:Uncharacterized protein n=1 Tax=Gaeumannomyces tritici (strain R3-111a-1) TaxID=644352 RepID=J3PKM8_GAET3|nr:hypothetical protein GGTG_14091 [Gaeumannomyces tritici R3-111a-1]EJT68329.1 hypothetical protein GGTG_14091 [Gaeumannomyces tritici R3-111a-1]